MGSYPFAKFKISKFEISAHLKETNEVDCVNQFDSAEVK